MTLSCMEDTIMQIKKTDKPPDEDDYKKASILHAVMYILFIIFAIFTESGMCLVC